VNVRSTPRRMQASDGNASAIVLGAPFLPPFSLVFFFSA